MNVLDTFSLQGKLAVVSGCDTGIGKAIAVALAEAGADIIGVSVVLDPGSEVEKEVLALGRKFEAHKVDFCDRTALYGFIEKVKKDHGNVDILINNAGMILRKPVAEHPDEYWDKLLSVNLDAQFI